MVYIIIATESDRLCNFQRFFHREEICLFRPLDSIRADADFSGGFPELFLKKGLISWGKYGIICFCIKGILCPE
jgi:hypothetical protein